MAFFVGVLPKTSRTVTNDVSTTYSSKTITVSDRYSAAHIVLDVDAVTGGRVWMTVKGVDGTSGKSYPIVQTPIYNTTGTRYVKIGADFVAASGTGWVAANDILPTSWSVDITVSGAVTYSVGASFV